MTTFTKKPLTYSLPVDGAKMILNPTGHFEGNSTDVTDDQLGALPFWLVKGLSIGENAHSAVTSRYLMPLSPMLGGKVNGDGLYIYPNDPELHPLAKAELKNDPDDVYFYQYGMISFKNKETGKTITYRMD